MELYTKGQYTSGELVVQGKLYPVLYGVTKHAELSAVNNKKVVTLTFGLGCCSRGRLILASSCIPIMKIILMLVNGLR